jgi:hypothetical protein
MLVEPLQLEITCSICEGEIAFGINEFARCATEGTAEAKFLSITPL